MLTESAAEVRNQAKLGIFTLKTAAGGQRELDGILLRCRLNERQMESVRKVLKNEDFESLSQYANTRYGKLTGANSSGAHFKQAGAGSDGFTRRSAGATANSMQQTFMSGPNNFLRPPGGQNETAYGTTNHKDRWSGSAQGTTTGFDNTQTTFKQRTTSVSKPVDRNLLDSFKELLEETRTSDWNKRVRAIDGIQ